MTAKGQSRPIDTPPAAPVRPLRPKSGGPASKRRSVASCQRPTWKARPYLFCFDVRCFDYRPPLLNICLVKRPDPFRRALLVRRSFQTKVEEQSAYRRIHERLDDSAVELGDDV